MAKDILISDERLSFSQVLATVLKEAGYTVLLTSEDNDNKALRWNRNTPFALQHLDIQLKTRNMENANSVLVFDAIEYAKIFSSDSLIAIDKTCSELITAYATLVFILKSLMIKQESGRLIFVLRNDENAAAENFAVNMAAKAFAELAENTAQRLSTKRLPKVQSLLVKLEVPDKNSAAWLLSQLELPVLSRNNAKWVKAGARGFFSK